MKTRITAIFAALTFSAALAIAAVAQVAGASNSNASDASKAACCQGTSCPMLTSGSCAMLNGGSCSMATSGSCAMMNGAQCPLTQNTAASAAPATKAKMVRKARPVAQSGCCTGPACGTTSGGKCSCSAKKGDACATPAPAK